MQRQIIVPLLGLCVATLSRHGRAGAEGRSEKISVRGRVLFRVELESPEGEEPTFDLLGSSARAEIRYRAQRWLRVVIEAELAAKRPIRDAYARLTMNGFSAQFGHFKAPSSRLVLASRWALPTVRRGLVDDVLTDRLLAAGRLPGAQVSWKGSASWRPALVVGAFQGTEEDGDFLEDAGVDGHTVAGRASARLGAVTFGLYGGFRAVEVADSLDHYAAGGADAATAIDFGGHTLRAWLDLFAVESWVATDADGTPALLAARLLVAWRLGGDAKGSRYAEPFLLAEVIEPDARRRSDALWAVAAGCNVGAWKRFRSTFEIEIRRLGPRAPMALEVLEHVALRIQIGAAF